MAEDSSEQARGKRRRLPRSVPNLRSARRAINGLPGLVVVEGDRVLRVMAFGIHDGLIQALFVITNPDKLRHLHSPK